MSFETNDDLTEIDETTDDAPVEDGHGEEAVESTEPEVDYFDLESVADRRTRLGEEEVTVGELKSGYLRQSDYTRKTQEIARLRQEAQEGLLIQAALRENPAEALAYLQRTFAAQQQPAEDEWDVDPLEQRINQLDTQYAQRFQVFEQDMLLRQTQQILGGLQSKYGDGFVADEVLERAVELGVHDPRHLESIYKEMAFDRHFSAQQSAAAKAQQEEQRRIQAKSQLASQVGGSDNVAAPATPSQATSTREAWEQAKAELGITWNDVRASMY